MRSSGRIIPVLMLVQVGTLASTDNGSKTPGAPRAHHPVGPSFECSESHIGDGRCDPRYNTELCGYDGGDCCECDCDQPAGSDYEWFCNDFECIDPSSACAGGGNFATGEQSGQQIA